MSYPHSLKAVEPNGARFNAPGAAGSRLIAGEFTASAVPDDPAGQEARSIGWCASAALFCLIAGASAAFWPVG